MSRPEALDVRLRDLGLAYRPQREWIEGRGLWLVVAHFLSGVGAGAWLLALAVGARGALLPALVCAALLSGAAHLLFLGRWERCWRILRRPASSWISRGIWSLAAFAVGGAGVLAVGAHGAPGRALLALSLLGALGALVYEGFVYSASKAIPFWHTRLLPVLYVAQGLRGGAALLLLAAVAGGAGSQLELIEAIKLWALVSTAVLVLWLLAVSSRAGGAARHSVRRLVVGGLSPAFYGGTIAVGILAPLALAAARELGAGGLAVLVLVALTSLAGDFYVKYCIAKAGTYVPLGLPGSGSR
jgi:formate-dependent nitrite reductase membrane component NrfD